VFAIDTNILIYAHNKGSKFHKKASIFVNDKVSKRDKNGEYVTGIPSQVFVEFINVITRSTIENPLSLEKAVEVVEKYLKAGIPAIHPRFTQLTTFLELAKSTTTRRKTFDLFLAATLKDNSVPDTFH